MSPFPVTPVVVIWGAAQHTVPDAAEMEGVRFLAGRHLVRWLRELDGDVVPGHAANDALRRMERYRTTAWQDS